MGHDHHQYSAASNKRRRPAAAARQGERCRAAYREQGSGAAVVFVHGALQDYQSWGNTVIDSLARHYRVITYSRRHNYPNKNAPARGKFSATTEAADLAAFFQAFYVSLFAQVREAFDKNDQDGVLRVTLRYFAGADVLDQIPPQMRAELVRNLPEWKAIAFAGNGFAGPARDAAGAIQTPTLLITADSTLPLLRPVNDELERVLPRVKRVRIANAPHELWQAHPTEVRQAVMDFLGRQ